ncbi:Protein PLASTID MOVEMENT IMPAIRED 2 like [Actinidia chinensis var. chinensis]|uniref:Protein PLASTID MOVEMENT IMPAIRED 2 like n=1 Tax=Actinidia chinensis var. chinensis TaxID=1590841 RepID=A0A2R6PA20_ACTCC|nr:Protein PLASTID MOVEMENT IMPAIRED 2 like [Actinidia chinensis var. chinensis]
MQKPDKLRKLERDEEKRAMKVRNLENHQYAEVMRELEHVKKELSKLKLDMASVLEEKNRAEKETEVLSLKISSYSSSAEALRKEIEEVNEEQVLVELAQIDAVKELAVIEVQRKEDAAWFSSAMESTRKKMDEFIQELDHAKEAELKLAVTTADINVLENELKLAKEMDKRVQRIESSRKGKELDFPQMLQSVREELEEAKKELTSIRKEGFQFMAPMDVIRDELKHVSQEAARLKKKEEKADFTVQNLNSNLLRAKAKLEAVSATEEKAKTILSNISLTLEQLKTEAEAAKKEREIVCEETTNIKAEVVKTESQIDLAEERLQAAMQELEAVKSSEARALQNLETLINNTVRARASASHHSSTITISKFEYEYLTGHAVRAEEIADKKVAAARAWIEALKASEKEILMKTEMSQRKIREVRVEEEQENHNTEKSLSVKRLVEGELWNWRGQGKRNSETGNSQLQGALLRKSVRENGSSTPVRRPKYQKAASPSIRHLTRSGSISVKKRQKVIPNLGKSFNNKSMERDS